MISQKESTSQVNESLKILKILMEIGFKTISRDILWFLESYF